ncbi:UNVERIFIED_CONTAM: hypothetical protein Slati_1581100 [Sesamum latifolium]|uniref:TPM domain-containing protein n=1 Tax=Sesamum latifolium TaxID=2727402 RepID=A0AAW2X887_9LAMI
MILDLADLALCVCPYMLCDTEILPAAKPASSFIPRKQPSLSVVKQSFYKPTSWLSNVHQGLAALAISLALNFSLPILTDSTLASEFDVLNEGPPKESYVVDDAGVLSRITKSDLKRLLSDLESQKGYHINVVAVRKLTENGAIGCKSNDVKELLERWYPTVEEGNKKGIVVLITSQKEGAAVGDFVLDGTVSENRPVLATEEKYNEAVFSSAKRLMAAIDGLPDPGGPQAKDNKSESNFKTREETDEKRGQFTLVVGGLLVIAFVVPMAQYYAYVSKK